MGCAAHDLIQWFSEADYTSFSVKSPSEPIAEVNLGREFDILDVLAVCYSIQNTKACRIYTLQRYNCYFLCLTILAVLTRLVARWETKIKADEWDMSLTVMYEHWSNLSPDQASGFPILAICAYLEPDNPRHAQFIFNILLEHLGSQAAGFARCNKTIRLTLWRADWKSALRTGLIKSLSAVPNLFEDAGYCSQQLKRVTESSTRDTEQAIMSCQTLLAKDYFRIWGEESFGYIAGVYELRKNLRRLWRIEHPVPLSKLALTSGNLDERAEPVIAGHRHHIHPAPPISYKARRSPLDGMCKYTPVWVGVSEGQKKAHWRHEVHVVISTRSAHG